MRGNSERKVYTKPITPMPLTAGWQLDQFREEVRLIAGRVIERGVVALLQQTPAAKRGRKRTEYALPNVPFATIESKNPVGLQDHETTIKLTATIHSLLDVEGNSQ